MNAIPNSSKRFPPGVGPEGELIYCCMGADFNSDRVARIENLLDRELDWEWIRSRAGANGAAPFVYQFLKRAHSDRIPEPIVADFRTVSLRSAAHSLKLKGELTRLLTELAAKGIPCMPLKGPVLAEQFYANPAQRDSGDLDILIRRNDVLLVNDLLTAQGFMPEVDLHAPTGSEHLDKDCELTLHHRESGVTVEVHWEMLPPIHRRGYDAEFVWSRARESEFEGKPAFKLPPEDMILFL